MTKMSGQKCKYLENERSFEDEIKKKTFFIVFKGLSLKQIKQIFLEDESPTLNYISKNHTQPDQFSFR